MGATGRLMRATVPAVNRSSDMRGATASALNIEDRPWLGLNCEAVLAGYSKKRVRNETERSYHDRDQGYRAHQQQGAARLGTIPLLRTRILGAPIVFHRALALFSFLQRHDDESAWNRPIGIASRIIRAALAMLSFGVRAVSRRNDW
jgi:hypothetical protein